MKLSSLGFQYAISYFDCQVRYEGGSESSVIGVITVLIDMMDCCIIP